MCSEEMGLATELYTYEDSRDNTLMHMLTALPEQLGIQAMKKKGMLQIMIAEELESL